MCWCTLDEILLVITSKVILTWSISFDFQFVVVLWSVDEPRRVLTSNEKIINIDRHIFILCLILGFLEPETKISSAGHEIHVYHDVMYSLCPY